MNASSVVEPTAEWPLKGLERVEKCPACGSHARRLLYARLADRSYLCAPGRWNLFRCQECSCAYLDPRPDEHTAHIAYENYYEGVAAHVPPARAGRWRRLRRALRNGYLNSRYGYRLAPASALGPSVARLFLGYKERADEHVRHLRLPPGRPRILDVGCGEGEFLAEMQALGWFAEGIDPSADAVAIARSRGVTVTKATLSDAALETASFDAITFRLVIEHLRDPASALRACRKALKPGGILWIATPNLESEGHSVFGEHWIHLQPPRHAVGYTPMSLMRLLADSGFEVIVLRPLCQARWSFRMSAAMARGLSPFANSPPLRGALALRARLTDLRALRRPEMADVMIVIARAA